MTPRLLALVLVLALLGCVSLPTVEDVRSFTLDDEWRLGDHLARELDQRLALHPDAEAQQLLAALGRPLVETGRLREREWRFVLVVDAEPFTLHAPGGRVFVSTGLVEAVDEVTQFSSLLAHEVAHAHLRHGTLQLTRAHGVPVMLSLARGERPAVRQDLAANLAAGGSFARFTHAAELEADREAERLLGATGGELAGLQGGLTQLAEGGAATRRGRSRYFACHAMDAQRSTALGRAPTTSAEPAYQDQAEGDRGRFAQLRKRLAH